MIKYLKNLFGVGEVDYKFDCVYDYIDEVEEVVDLRLAKEVNEIMDALDSDRVATLSVVFALATVLKVPPVKIAKVLTSENMLNYLNEVNDAIEKSKVTNAQKKKSVK